MCALLVAFNEIQVYFFVLCTVAIVATVFLFFVSGIVNWALKDRLLAKIFRQIVEKDSDTEITISNKKPTKARQYDPQNYRWKKVVQVVRWIWFFSS